MITHRHSVIVVMRLRRNPEKDGIPHLVSHAESRLEVLRRPEAAQAPAHHDADARAKGLGRGVGVVVRMVMMIMMIMMMIQDQRVHHRGAEDD
jgi:hypothetical protein